MMDLNKAAKDSFEIAVKRHLNGANICPETLRMLKHCATEVVEATNAYTIFDTMRQLKKDDFSLNEYRKDFQRELADVIACILIICGNEEINAEEIVLNCIKKNRKRANKTGDKL